MNAFLFGFLGQEWNIDKLVVSNINLVFLQQLVQKDILKCLLTVAPAIACKQWWGCKDFKSKWEDLVLVYIIIWFRLCKCFLIKGFQRGRRFESLSEFSMHLDSIFRIQELLKTLNSFLKWEGKLPISASTGSSLSGAPNYSTALCSLLRLCRATVELCHLCKEPDVRDGHVLVIESLQHLLLFNCKQVE